MRSMEFIGLALGLAIAKEFGHGILIYALFGGIGTLAGYGVKKLLSHRKPKEKKSEEEKQSFWEL